MQCILCIENKRLDMKDSKRTSIRVSKELLRFLHDCKHKSRSKSIEDMLRKVGGQIWNTCEQIEREYNAKLIELDYEGKEDYYILQPHTEDN